ncbi:hypothetical protein [Streptomyces daghestanicus]|jgi:hypothetical protein|uniref:Uncharacterized protein n=1 Tax=Streptomyces daghestanicus TaxID=66885 RepID=A0ABQ3Q7J1_9ACTN|nr:hypothetical protein [Streptomyces daghestanicus]GGU69063.1 hypothetical protein GCM10010259_68640 [Streptomyces daghestanicus]GHI33256.1 hypothetical protein Sdagh_49860 [Streptomyces daghestanicus]
MTGETRELPPAIELPRARYSGWACVWCGASLRHVLAVPAGRATGYVGAHDMSTEVSQCPPGYGCEGRSPYIKEGS